MTKDDHEAEDSSENEQEENVNDPNKIWNKSEIAGRSGERSQVVEPKRKLVNQEWNYDIEETKYKLAILVNPKTLTVALRHVIRKLHVDGDRITFPIPDAVDRIMLKKS